MVFIVILSAIGIMLAFLYLQSLKQMRNLKKQLDNTQLELKKSFTQEQILNDKVTELQNQSQLLLKDPVTGLLGWQLFEDRLNQNIKESARYNLILGVLFVDIDDFKVINDALNYQTGDEVLREVARRLQASIRQVDSVSRFTKDTFGIVLTQLAKPETAAIIAQRILQALSQPCQINDQELFITACIGITIYPSDADNASALLRSADQALHVAKEKGRNLYQFYREQTHVKSQRELTMYMSLNRESIFEEFELRYQPIFNTKDESILCMEILINWYHPELGTLTSTELLNFAEKHRKLNALTEWLLIKACKQFKQWQTQGFLSTMIAIPISIKQLENSHFIYTISQILQSQEFKPECLLLQVNVHQELLPIDVLEKSSNMLRYLGIKIAINNFASDSFPLNILKLFSVNYLKLCAPIIVDVTSNALAAALTKSIVLFANSLNIEVIAQDVETEEQRLLLQSLGIHLLEGAALSDALLADDIINKFIVST